MVLMNDRLYAAREVTKTNTSRVETFQAPEHGPLAIADHDTLYFNRARSIRHRAFDLSNVRELPRVDTPLASGVLEHGWTASECVRRRCWPTASPSLVELNTDSCSTCWAANTCVRLHHQPEHCVPRARRQSVPSV